MERVSASENVVGSMIRRWRVAHGLSQMELAEAAGVSTRHLSFLETGRAQPSREMLRALGAALDAPLRERNAAFLAAGFAPEHSETPLDAPRMAEFREALVLLLRQQEPFGAVVFDRRWDVVMVNGAYARFVAMLSGQALTPYAVLPPPRLNGLVQILDPKGMRPHIANWTAVARAVIDRARGEMAADRDDGRRMLRATLLALPDVAAMWGEPPAPAGAALVVPVELRVGDQVARLLTTIATLGTAQDVTLQELRIETFHPADAATADLARQLASLGG